MSPRLLAREISAVSAPSPIRVSGRVTHSIGLVIESHGPEVSVGEMCWIRSKKGEEIPAEVVGFKEEKVLLIPLGEGLSLSCGAEVYPVGEPPQVGVGEALCGRVLDALGRPIDGKGDLFVKMHVPLISSPPPPLTRKPIDQVLETGIAAIDALCTLGKGQRIGIFSPPGVGKSTLLGQLAKQAKVDVNVIALIGERGREVRDFIEKELGPEGLARSVVVVATSDEAAPLRRRGALLATAIAEYFRDKGREVLFMMDSVSRYALSLQEIGLAVGEPPTTKGFPPSVFAALPRLFERAGTSSRGSITGVYTVLTEEDEFHDPIPDQVRSLLDGHLHLSKKMAEGGKFPPIDILKSLSRLMPQITTESHRAAASQFRALLHAYLESEELIQIGAYVSGSQPTTDRALEKIGLMEEFLVQSNRKPITFEMTIREIQKVVS
ncbi:MAG: putative ATP synthase YscN [Chlamydiae bacterium]|nr:putative ATP synthase YscN [Chlamydiota bacterium]